MRVLLRDKMLRLIRDAGPSGIAPREVAPRLYDNADGGPEWALSCVYVMAFKLRKCGAIRVEGCTHEARYIACT